MELFSFPRALFMMLSAFALFTDLSQPGETFTPEIDISTVEHFTHT